MLTFKLIQTDKHLKSDLLHRKIFDFSNEQIIILNHCM